MMQRSQKWNCELGNWGILAPGRWLWLRATGWNLLLFLGTFFFFLATLMQFPWLHLPTTSPLAIGLVGPMIAFLVYALVVRKGEQRPAREVMPSWLTGYELLVGTVIGFSMVVAMLALPWALGLYHVERSHIGDWFSFFVFNSYISGMLEELAFRAILLRLFWRAFGPGWGLALSSVAFGAAHLSHANLLEAGEVAFNAGLTTGLLYMATGRLWMSIAMHTAYDFTEGAILGVDDRHGLLLSTPVAGKPEFLTGGTYGPDGSLLATAVGAIFIVGIVYANSRGLLTLRKR